MFGTLGGIWVRHFDEPSLECRGQVVFQELVARGEPQGGHHLTDGHGAVKDIQQALEFRGGTVAKKWRQTGRSQDAIRRRDKGRRGRTSRRRTVGHRGRAEKPLSTRRGAIKCDELDGAEAPSDSETRDEGAGPPDGEPSGTGAEREKR